MKRGISMKKELLAVGLGVALFTGLSSYNVSAESVKPTSAAPKEKVLTSFDLNSPVQQERKVTMQSGEVATAGITPVIEDGIMSRAKNGNYKAYWYTGSYNCSFKFTVKGNKITRVYDKWYMMLGVS